MSSCQLIVGLRLHLPRRRLSRIRGSRRLRSEGHLHLPQHNGASGESLPHYCSVDTVNDGSFGLRCCFSMSSSQARRQRSGICIGKLWRAALHKAWLWISPWTEAKNEAESVWFSEMIGGKLTLCDAAAACVLSNADAICGRLHSTAASIQTLLSILRWHVGCHFASAVLFIGTQGL